MTATSEPRLKITYATLRNDNEQLHASYDAGLAIARGELGATHALYINGEWRMAPETFEKRSPVDGSLVGRFAKGTRQDVRDAIAAARAAAPSWARTPWSERIAVMRRLADIISERQMELAALMGIEVGKNRLEALGDVEETADLIRYYCDQIQANDGFDHPMGNLGDPTVHTRSVLKPHGVWAVISPFNFPLALSGGPSGGALVAGNAVVYKPSSDAPLCGLKLAEIADQAGLPRGAFNMVSGPGATVGAELQENEGVDGMLFTGSYEIGFNEIFKTFSKRYPKPVVVEMGGKNPAIVSARADLEEAAEGVMRSAFGYGGQKCSACSRVYVQAPVYDAFLEALVAKTKGISVGDPTDRKVWLGPLVNAKARAKYDAAVAEAKRDGRVIIGGEVLDGHGTDLYVAPTVVADLPADHRIWRDELFVPLVAVAKVSSLDEAIERANDTIYGLTAGFFSDDREEISHFEEASEAGVIYINRRAGATTGAWPGIQPFGGWKGSGTSGKASGGLYYVPQFMREQSQTLVD
ncbi:MAG TPA: aldehyde dehydrogenase family protein [Candidatus Limnocylindrales bacterium]|jgi:1-pyrroline-5-carboxylate dehydrogenase